MAEQNSSRREFLRGVFRKTSRTALDAARDSLGPGPARFVRPPGARPEDEFLEACTRCGECIPACPHGTVFLLRANAGAAAQTPALDLSNGACHLCADFPCIAACEPGALRPVAVESLKLAGVRIDPATCLPFLGPECGVCVSVCPVPGAISLQPIVPEINPAACTGCAMCREACVVTPPAISVHPLVSG